MAQDAGTQQSSPYDVITEESAVNAKVERLAGVLRHVELFSGLSERQLRELAQLAREEQVGTDTVLMQQGGEGNALIVFLGGSARVERNGAIVAQIPEGSYVGEMALLDGKPRSATVVTNGDADLVILSKPVFDHMLQSTPAMRDTLMMVLVERLRRVMPGPLD
jgi:CRP-like cAMP-binding protein